MEFLLRASPGKLEMGPYNRARFNEFVEKNPGLRWRLTLLSPESRQQRKFVMGGLIPLLTFYHEKLDHHSADDCHAMFEIMKRELLGELEIDFNGKAHRIGRSTKGREALRDFTDKLVDYIVENYAPPVEAITPEKYKHWVDTIFPFGGPDNYIDYLVSTGVLKKV